MKVDIHSHVVPSEVLGAAGDLGPFLDSDSDGTLSVRIGDQVVRARTVASQEQLDSGGELEDPVRRYTDPSLRLQEMKELGIDVIGVTTLPHFFLYWADPKTGERFAAAQNDGLARYCDTAPDRFFFMATVPLQSPEGATKEAERALDDLGARGLNIGATDLPGLGLYREDLFPLFELAAHRHAPIFIHPAPLTLSPGYVRQPFLLDQIALFPYLITKAVTELVMGGVLERLPDLNVCLSHGGGFLPYQVGRLTTMGRVASDRKVKGPIDGGLGQIYSDILVHDLRGRRLLVDVLGADHLLAGDNYAGLDSADAFAMLQELELTPEENRMIEGETAASLFNLGNV